MKRDHVHQWFGLTYASYFVAPRMALQAMPEDWQRRFVDLMTEFEATGIETPSYHVLRDSEAHTVIERCDDEDPESPPYRFTAIDADPWAQYKYPDFDLLPESLRPRRAAS